MTDDEQDGNGKKRIFPRALMDFMKVSGKDKAKLWIKHLKGKKVA